LPKQDALDRTVALCDECNGLSPARLQSQGQKVFLLKKCPRHGARRALASTNPKRFFDFRFDLPGRRVAQTYQPNGTTKNPPRRREDTKKTLLFDSGKAKEPIIKDALTEMACPEKCGICDEHTQHICNGLVEVTGRCDLKCPICYAEGLKPVDLTLTQYQSRVKDLLRAEGGNLEVLQISGGEPTLHPLFPEILRWTAKQKIGRILLNTHGLRLLKDPGLYEAVRRLKDRVELYLQFDGFDRAASRRLRGLDALDKKMQLLDKTDKDGIKVTLTCTVAQANLKQVAPVLEEAVKRKHVSGVCFQRLFKAGRAGKGNLESVMADQIVDEIAKGGRFKGQDLLPLPCSHPQCTTVGYLYCEEGKTLPLNRVIPFRKHIETFANRIIFGKDVLNYFRRRLRDPDGVWWKPLGFLANVRSFFLKSRMSTYRRGKVLRVHIKNFMDRGTFDTQRAKKCCVGIAVGGGRIIPFCVRNNGLGGTP
jgi:hypothetical protein